MAFPVTLNGRTYTLADFEGNNYVDGLPDAFEDFVTQAGSLYSTTSTTSNAVGTGSKTFTVEASKPYQVGTPLRIADTAAPSTNWMDAIVTSYSGTTLVVNAVSFAGSGTKTAWSINIGGGGTSYTGTLPVAQGGTGATTAADARTNLDVYSKSEADGRYINVTGDGMTSNLTFGDSVKATFGAGSDLQVYHDGSNSYIDDAGTGSLYIRGTHMYLQRADGTENYIGMLQDGAVTLYYDGSSKLSTTSAGVGVVGILKPHQLIPTTDVDSAATPGVCVANETDTGFFRAGANAIGASTGGTERMRIDASGVLVGKTATNYNNTGVQLFNAGYVHATADGANVVTVNRKTSDGNIVECRKDGTLVGSIGCNSGNIEINSGSNLIWLSHTIRPKTDNLYDVGGPSNRWDDVYATNGTIQTSDRNEKQDIEELSEAERRVAVAAKGLIRKYRWIDSVQEKGDDARIHIGVIAQDLQAAFEAEGLDAGRYAMFISSTWWEKERVIPAIEAQDAVYEDVVIPAILDDEGNEIEPETTETRLVSEAVEGREEQTVIDTFATAEEAPEGATERTRLGVRYPELLAFIIGAL